MSVPNFSFLACLVKVAEKFVVLGGGWVEHVATMSNLNPNSIELDLGMCFGNYIYLS